MQSRRQDYSDYGYNDKYQDNVSFQRHQEDKLSWPTNSQQSAPKPQSNEFNDMDMQLELMKRKRQMIHEQRQLIEEQQQLDLLQRQYDNTQRNNYSNYGNTYSSQGTGRGIKRPAPAQTWADKPKRFAGIPPLLQKLSYPIGNANSFRPKYTPKVTPSARMESKPSFAPRPSTFRPSEIFRSKESASRSTLGKMEVLLGTLVREMRNKYFGEPYNMSLSTGQMKMLKERLRDRIHKMMLGKTVNSNEEMHQMYRKLHTFRGDLRLLHNILKKSESESIERPAQLMQIATKMPEVAPVVAQMPPNAATAKETDAIGKFVRYNIHKLLEPKMDEIFAKLLKICNEDAALAAKEPVPIIADTSETEQSEDKKAAEETAVETAKETEGDKLTEGDKPGVTNVADMMSVSSRKEEEDERERIAKGKVLNTEELFEFFTVRAMRKKMAEILPRYKNYMITMIANDKQLAHLAVKGVENPTPLKRAPLFFAKVLGVPSLPSRNITKEFLDQFGCASIKKHKKMYNLLIVGVSTKESLEKLLACDGIVLGGKTLEILPSVKDTLMAKEMKTEDASQIDAKNSVLSEAIEDLNSEIDSLLTSLNENIDGNAKFESEVKGNSQESEVKGNGQETEVKGNGQESEDKGNGQESEVKGNGQESEDKGNGQETEFKGNGQESEDKGNAQESEVKGNGQESEVKGNGQESEVIQEIIEIVDEEVKADVQVKKEPKPSLICTRRSSRLPQKN